MAVKTAPFLITILLLAFISIMMPQPGSAQSYITPNDLVIEAFPQIELNKQLSLNQAVKLFGPPISYTISYGETWSGWQATFDNLELWVLGATDKKTPGLVVRVILKDPSYTTARGIRLGTPETKVLSIYGEPGYSSIINGITWHRYFIQNGLQRILFGIDSEGNVIKIGYSFSAGGL